MHNLSFDNYAVKPASDWFYISGNESVSNVLEFYPGKKAFN